METKCFPVFVYGTLLPGQPNSWIWDGSDKEYRAAIFPNGRLFDLGHYPVLVEAEAGLVHGKLITVDSDRYLPTLHRLDALEGYDPSSPVAGDFRRVIRQVRLADNSSEMAWVYLGRKLPEHKAVEIKSGDWLAYSAAKQAKLLEWWSRAWPKQH